MQIDVSFGILIFLEMPATGGYPGKIRNFGKSHLCCDRIRILGNCPVNTI
jgi:hypothetical protein